MSVLPVENSDPPEPVQVKTRSVADFVRDGGRASGTLESAGLSRLEDLISGPGQVGYVLEAARTTEGKPAIRVEVAGTLTLTCQRCLAPMQFAVEVDSVLELLKSDVQADIDLTDQPDGVLAERQFQISELVEDEIILTLPYAPRHDDCPAALAGQAGGVSGSSELAKPWQQQLAKLRKSDPH